jgi:hypothetical protein
MQPTLPLEAFIKRCKFCDHQLDGRSKHFCTTCLPPLSQWANPKDYGKHYNILRSAIGVGQEGQNKCRIPSTHPAYIQPPRSPARVVQKNCIQCNTQFEGKQGGSDHCSYKCSRVTALDKLRQGRLTRIQIQADELFPRSDVDLTAFAALVADFLSKQTLTLYKRPRRKRERHNDAPIRCNMCQETFTRTGTGVKNSYCATCSPKVLRWYHSKDDAPLLAERQCARCTTIFRPELGKPTKFCSTSCSAITIQPMPLTCRLVQCNDCNAPYKPRGGATRCERCQFISMATRQDANSAKRAHIERAGDKDISWQTVGQRDSWICHLCLKKVPQQPGKAKSPKGATVDHLIPLARGGEHVWENVALAHNRCNMSRSTQGIAQLKLVS